MFGWQTHQLGGYARVDAGRLLPALGFASVSFALRIARFHFFLHGVGARPTLVSSACAQLAGFSLSVTPGKVGELYKCCLIEQSTGIPAARTAPIVLFEKGMDALAFATLAVLAAAMLPNIAGSVSIAARSLVVISLLTGLGLIALRVTRPEKIRLALGHFLGGSPLGRRFIDSATLALAGSIDLLNPLTLCRNLLLSLVARACDGLTLGWTAAALGINLPLLAGVFVLNSSGVLGGFSMLPGGIGVVEAAMSLLLASFGAPVTAALATALAARMLSFWLWVALGLVALIRSGPSAAQESSS